MEDFILSEMERLNADGVDFVPLFTKINNIIQIYESYTKEEWISSDKSYPKTQRLYWKMINGKKEYII